MQPPSIAPVAHVMFENRGAEGHPGDTIAVCEVLVPVKSVTLNVWLRQRAAARGAGRREATGKPAEVVRQVFLQLANAVQLLHSRNISGVLHGETVRVQALEGDSGLQVVLTALPIDTAGGVIPEALSDEQPFQGLRCGTTASDMYLIGSWMYEALFGRTPVLLPRDDVVAIPTEVPGAVGSMGARLGDLLRRLLRANPQSRISSFEFTAHSAMTALIVTDMHAENLFASMEEKRALLRERCATLKLAATWNVDVSRSEIVNSTLAVVMRASPDSLRMTMKVNFIGEPAVDAGGPTKELFHQFFTALTRTSCDLFVASEGTTEPLFLPYPDPEDSEGHPMGLPNDRRRKYEGVGRMLAKCIFDGRIVPVQFAPSFFKFLLNREPNLHDLDGFNPDMGRFNREIMEYSPQDVSSMGMDFSFVGGSEMTSLTDNNRAEFVRRQIPWELVGRRRRALEAIKRGFDTIAMTRQLALFTIPELMALVVGNRNISADDVIAKLRFREYPSGSCLPVHFKEAVRRLSQRDLLRFLVYVTAQATLPDGNIGIHFYPDRVSLYRAHTCFNTLDVPDIAELEDVQRRMRTCLDNLEAAGFGFA